MIRRSLFYTSVLVLSLLLNNKDATANDFSFLPSDKERESTTSVYPKFHSMLDRHKVIDLLPLEADIMCEAGDGLSCGRSRYLEIIEDVSSYEGNELLQKLDHIYDQVPYERDSINYGEEDYWATPEEFLERNLGDCEEYAIAKYLTLKELGWSDDAMRIVVLWDSEISEHHAVLVVKSEEKEWILDNATQGLKEYHDFPHYRPVYAINKSGSWSYNLNRNSTEYAISSNNNN